MTDPLLAALRELQHRQDGVLARRQLFDHGARNHDLDRLLRRRELTRVHPGVYVDHTGPLTWRQRAWAAVLAGWPAALTAESDLPGPPPAPLHVAIGLGRSLAPLPDVRWHRTAHLQSQVSWVRSPPRVRPADAVVAALSGRSEDEQFRLLAEACGSRATTVAAVREAIGRRARLSGRAGLEALLDDLESGAASVLERAYLDLERAHGLPQADRQAALMLPGRRGYADAPYPAYGLRVELDGRAHHDSGAARDLDADRDLDVRLSYRATTVRLTWGQVSRRGCSTIAKVAVLLQRGGWTGSPHPCPRC